MRAKVKRLIEELCQEVQARYPESKIISSAPVPDGGYLILVETPDEKEEIRISEEMADRSLDILLKEGVSISVGAHYPTDGNKQPL